MFYQKTFLFYGWSAFVFSLMVYTFTLEPSASFWDCGEFIACAYKMEIAHPPGAPLFTLTARLFAAFAGTQTTRVAFSVNMLSAVCSALTIAFLFWTIVLLAQKISSNNKLVILSGFVGSIAFAFTDSFWFSAVEAEVYAMSSLFTAITFWAILKWEKHAIEPGADRWLVLIAYLLGLSVGVHLLNLLAIPAMVLVFYFKKFSLTKTGLIIAIGVAVWVPAFIFKLLIPGIPYIGAHLDKLLVNTFSMAFNFGLLLFFITCLGILAFLAFKKYPPKRRYLRMISSLFFVFMLGYSSYTTVIVRSLANPPIDMNNPDNPFSLISYLNREQYASRPLVHGNYYNAPVVSHEKRSTFVPFDSKYISDPLNPQVNYDERFSTFFPRMASTDVSHAEAYKKWADIQGKTMTVPTFGENLRFFFKYQVGHMYLRYFLWNFSGRQNDIQGFGGKLNGNWITGIAPLDKALLGSNAKAPGANEANKSRNTYFLLPLLFGIAGLLIQLKRRKLDFWVLFTLFVMTGLAIVVYLNEIPVTPRERDYVYVGSFYVFAMWIGLGVLHVHEFISRFLTFKIAFAITSVVTIAGVPLLLFMQNFDDHNRSNRYIASDFARNYLESCQPNAILFTTADNDTYPVWYAQEVEGFRTDVNTVLLPYLSANWYINQKRRKIYDASPLPLSLAPEKFVHGQRSYIPVLDKIKEPVNLKDLLKFVASDNRKTKIQTRDSNYINYLPARKFFISQQLPDGTETKVFGEIDGNYVLKSDLIVLDILANNAFQRPVYFLNPLLPNKLGLKDYLKREGFAYRLSPDASEKYLTKRNYELLMNDFQWGNLSGESIFVDWTSRRTIGLVLRVRNDFAQLAQALLNEGRREIALEVAEKCLEVLPTHKIIPDASLLSIAAVYDGCGEKATALKIIDDFSAFTTDTINFLESFVHKDEEILFELRKHTFYLKKIDELKSSFNDGV